MGVGQGVADLGDHGEHLVACEGLVFDDVVEVGSLDELHDDVEDGLAVFAGGFAEVVDGHDALVAEARHGFGFALKAFSEVESLAAL